MRIIHQPRENSLGFELGFRVTLRIVLRIMACTFTVTETIIEGPVENFERVRLAASETAVQNEVLASGVRSIITGEKESSASEDFGPEFGAFELRDLVHHSAVLIESEVLAALQLLHSAELSMRGDGQRGDAVDTDSILAQLRRCLAGDSRDGGLGEGVRRGSRASDDCCNGARRDDRAAFSGNHDTRCVFEAEHDTSDVGGVDLVEVVDVDVLDAGGAASDADVVVQDVQLAVLLHGLIYDSGDVLLVQHIAVEEIRARAQLFAQRSTCFVLHICHEHSSSVFHKRSGATGSDATRAPRYHRHSPRQPAFVQSIASQSPGDMSICRSTH